ncbi:MAG: CCXG family PEP-CTERM protein [Pseudomonadota bacterium]
MSIYIRRLRSAIKPLLIAVTALVSTSAMATLITYEVRHTNSGVNNTDYLASWNAQTSAITTIEIDSLTNIRAPGSHHHSHLRVEFNASALDNILFQIAPDAGFGGALYMNNTLVQQRATDLWWGYNWTRTGETLLSHGAALFDGTNVLDVYWAEACCNGGQSGRFSIDGGDTWMALSVDNLRAATVPEPGMLILFGTGLFGLVLARRSRLQA